MATITEKDIDKLADLSRLDYSDPAAKAAMADELNKILDFISQLKQVDTESVEPMASTVADASTRERDDEVTDENGEGEEDALVAPCAPASEMGFFVVPKVIE